MKGGTMEEEQKPQEEVTPSNPVDDAKKVVEDFAKLKDEVAPMVKELQELKARDILGGQSSAGTVQEEPKEETNKEYMERILRGDKDE